MNLQSKEIYPLLVSQEHGVPDTPEVRESIWTKARSLPQEVQDLLLSDEIKIYILEKSQEAGLDLDSTEQFSRLVRAYFFKEAPVEDIANGVGAVFQKQIVFGQTILAEIESIHISKDPAESQVTQETSAEPAASELLTLEAAYEKYPQVLKQLVTTNKIVSKPFLNPLSPTVGNWIAVYEKINGVKKHSTLERGDFLYRSQACRAISDFDRNKLSQLLSARDEDTTLLFDTQMGGILWQKKSSVAAPTQPAEAVSSAEKISQKAPVEETTSVATATQGESIDGMGVKNEPAQQEVSDANHPFTPSISRRHTSSHLGEEPQIVTRPRMKLGASGSSAPEPKPLENSSNPTQAQKSAPQLVGSARQHPSSTPHAVTAPSPDSIQQPGTQEKKGSSLASGNTSEDLKVNFSSGQTLPAEKAKDQTEATIPEKTSEPKMPKRSPFHIDPMGRGN